MPVDDLAYATIAASAPRIRSGELTATALTQACLDRIERFDSRVNAFITRLDESQRAVAELEQVGAERVDVPFSDAIRPSGSAARMAEAATFHEQWLRERPGDYGADVRESLESASKTSAVDFVKNERARASLLVEMREIFGRVDVLVTPTLPVTATRIGEREVDIDAQRVTLHAQLTRFTLPFNQVGYPAASAPCGFDGQGLPIGLQIAGRPWAEATVLRVAHTYQQASEWHRRRPTQRMTGEPGLR